MAWKSAPRVKDDLDIDRWPKEITKAVNQLGNTQYGSASISPDANGNGTIAHKLPSTPTYVSVGILGDNSNHAKVQAVSATNITVLIIDSTGADVAAGTFTIYWTAKV